MTLRTYNMTINKREIVLRMDVDLACTSEWWIDDHFNNNLIYEQEVALLMAQALRPGDVAIDVGANIGFFSLFMAQFVSEAGKVIAFEPGEKLLTKLNYNISLNPDLRNIEVVSHPLWCRQEVVTYWEDTDSGGGGNALWDPGLFVDNKKSAANPLPTEMDATTLDFQFLYTEPRLIKLDTEGSEQRILEGGCKLLDRARPPFIITEMNPFGMEQMGCSAETYREFMQSYGYDMFFMHTNGMMPTLIPRKTRISYYNGVAVFNALFSTPDALAELWPLLPFPPEYKL